MKVMRRPEEDMRFLGTGITSGCMPPHTAELCGDPSEQQMPSSTEPSLQQGEPTVKPESPLIAIDIIFISTLAIACLGPTVLFVSSLVVHESFESDLHSALAVKTCL